MNSPIEIQIENMNLEDEQQPLTPSGSFTDELDKILASEGWSVVLADNGLHTVDPNDISALINPASNDHFGDDSSPNMGDLFSSFFDSPSEELTHSTFIEQDGPQDSFHQPLYSSVLSSEPVGSSPVESRDNQNLNDVQTCIERQNQLLRTATVSKSRRTHQQSTTTVEPVSYTLNSGGCQPYAADQMQYNDAYQEQWVEYKPVMSEKIQIVSQPRSNFRPRTQNESKNSSHYLRCEEGIKPEYPTIKLRQEWDFHSDINLIEVALVGLDEQPHPYSITNKQCLETFEENALIFRQNESNVLYFVLTKEDFCNGQKTFMLELIKGKQSDVITKELIRERQLEHSKLRFTRIFQLGKGNFQRDDESMEYSTVMSEAYGDVDIEHMGPRYGPMGGQEMVYAVLKGRILKSDLKIEIVDNITTWRHVVNSFTKNGNVIYFLMPANPNPHMLISVQSNIVIYYKGEELFQTTYLYKGSLDQDLAELRLNDLCTTTTTSSMSTSFNVFDFSSATGARFSSSTSKKPTVKRAKRLDKKPRGQGDKK